MFLDEPNLRSVAAALWDGLSVGKASVMIGAGFSRNAVPASPTLHPSKPFPGWGELTAAMARELHSSPDEKSLLDKAVQAASSTSGSLRIADEYFAWKGRGKLDALLRRSIPDKAYNPGRLHQLLFRLPWSDVLTTNYDTLLERAAGDQIERPFSVVRSQQDIPGSAKPRIVKLHGSFPDSKPFIITEDDFRTYDQTHPAMVNLVQQCFVETTCCLIGFSGDDPNFLRWTGWVRDVLGPSHMEPVYLVGLFDHTPARRALLERRHVRSIDLAPLFPEANWPNISERHQAATEWFLRALMSLKPPTYREWPKPAVIEMESSSFEGSPALPKLSDNGLMAEVDGPSLLKLKDGVSSKIEVEDEQRSPQEHLAEYRKQNSGENLRRKVKRIVEIWKHNRERYPGWLTLSWFERNLLESQTIGWIDGICSSVRSVEPRLALGWLHELQWRLERCLLPWPSQLVDVVEEILGPDGFVELIADAETREVALQLSVQQFRAYRELGRQVEFEEWGTRIEKQLDRSTEQFAFFTHQKVLACLEVWRIENAEKLLLDWDVSGLDPIFRARKAALLGELANESANAEAQLALKEIQAIGGPQDIDARSREAEIIGLVRTLVGWMSPHERTLRQRHDELRAQGFAISVEERLASMVAGQPTDTSITPPRKTRNQPSAVLSAFLARRVIEETASIVRMPGIVSSGSLVSVAVPWMALESPTGAIRFSVRNRDHGSSATLLNLSSLAMLNADELAPIIEGIFASLGFLAKRLKRYSEEPQYGRILSGESDHTPADGVNWMIKGALQHLREISPVFSEEQLVAGLQACFKLRASWRAGQWQTWEEIETTLVRLLEQCSEDSIAEQLTEILEQPIVGFDTDGLSPLTKYDALSRPIVRLNRTLERNFDLSKTRLEDLFEQLDKHPSIETRARIATRLSSLWQWGALDKESEKRLIKSIGKLNSEAESKSKDQEIEYFFTAFDRLLIPELTEGSYRKSFSEELAEQKWEPQIIQREGNNPRSIKSSAGPHDPIFVASRNTREPWHDDILRLSAEEWRAPDVTQMLKRAKSWLKEEGKELLAESASGNSPLGRFDDRAKLIVEFCRKVVLLKSFANRKLALKASSILFDLQDLGVITTSAIGVHVAAGKLSSAEASDELRQSASSLEPQNSIAFLTGVLAWLAASDHDGATEPPEDLIREVAVAVRGRRAPDLWWAICVATIILQKYPDCIDESFRRDLVFGLRFLVIETDVNSPSLDVSKQQGSLEKIRKACVDLVRALHEFPEGEEIAEVWMKKADDETVRFIKNAFRSLGGG